MAQVPSGTRFIGIATSVDLVERKSAVLNKETQPYTIEDIVLSVPAGPAGPQGVQGPAGPIGPVGPAGLNWQGSWVSGTSYVADDAVGYNGASWFCILATSGTTTPNLDTTHWALLASQGAQGIQGVQGPAGAQGPAGNPATQTLQQTVDLGNTVTTTNYQSFITSGAFAITNLITNDESFLAADKLSFGKAAGVNSLELIPSSSLSGSRIIEFPNNSGTVALLSDIPSTAPTLQNVTDSGNTITFGGYETILAAGAVSVGTIGFGSTLLNPDYVQFNNGTNYINLGLPNTLTGSRSIKFPDAAGTIALTSDVTLQKAVTGGNNFVSGVSKITLTAIVAVENTSLLTKSTLEHNKLSFTSNASGLKTTNLRQSLTPTVNRTIYLPDADGTIALTSDLSLQNAFDAGRTMTTDNFTIGVFDAASGLSVKNTSSSDEIVVETTKVTFTKNSSGLKTTNLRQAVTPTANRTITLPDADGTIALQTAASGSFVSQDGKTVTVVNGIITSIVS